MTRIFSKHMTRSGASKHMTHDKNIFNKFQAKSHGSGSSLGSGSTTIRFGSGLNFPIWFGFKSKREECMWIWVMMPHIL
jgi:hypothetical protein